MERRHFTGRGLKRLESPAAASEPKDFHKNLSPLSAQDDESSTHSGSNRRSGRTPVLSSAQPSSASPRRFSLEARDNPANYAPRANTPQGNDRRSPNDFRYSNIEEPLSTLSWSHSSSSKQSNQRGAKNVEQRPALQSIPSSSSSPTGPRYVSQSPLGDGNRDWSSGAASPDTAHEMILRFLENRSRHLYGVTDQIRKQDDQSHERAFEYTPLSDTPLPSLNLSRIFCPAGTQAVTECIANNENRPDSKTLNYAITISYGPYIWGTRSEQCMWLYQQLEMAVPGCTSLQALKILFIIHMLLKEGSCEMTEILYHKSADIFAGAHLDKKGLMQDGTSPVTLLYMYQGYVNSFCDYLYTSQRTIAAGDGPCKGQFLSGSLCTPGTYEKWLDSLDVHQLHTFLSATFEILKAAVILRHIELKPEDLHPMGTAVVENYINDVKALFTCCATILEKYFCLQNNIFFSDSNNTQAARYWAADVLAYEKCVRSLSEFFDWADTLKLKVKVQIPHIRPMPHGFAQHLKQHLFNFSTLNAAQLDSLAEVLSRTSYEESSQPLTSERENDTSGPGHPDVVSAPELNSLDTSEDLQSTQYGDDRQESREGHGRQSLLNSECSLKSITPLDVVTATQKNASSAQDAANMMMIPGYTSSLEQLQKMNFANCLNSGSLQLIHPLEVVKDFFQRPSSDSKSTSSLTSSQSRRSRKSDTNGSTETSKKNGATHSHCMVMAEDAQCGYESADRFKVFRNQILGRGSFGVVYRSWDDAEGTFLACKELTFDAETMGKTMMALFREYSLLTNLRHPNIVSVVSFLVKEDKGRIFMEWMPTGSLQSVLELLNCGLRENVVRRYVRDALRGLEYLHSKGIVHRDVKPGNMLLSARGTVKLTDFGSSRSIAYSVESVKTLNIVGTLAYLAPDSIRGHYSYASDIWSLGCSALHMATGRPPWDDGKTESVGLIFKIGSLQEGRHKPPYNLSAVNFSDDFEDFINTALTFDRRKRPTASELLQHPFCQVNELPNHYS